MAKKTKSIKPGKQRKRRATAPLHRRKKMLKTHLSNELRKRYAKRAFPIRQGDTVKIVRGGFKGHIGKVTKVDHKKLKVYVEGAHRLKRDGTKALYPIDPSNLLLIELKLEDKKRIKALERK